MQRNATQCSRCGTRCSIDAAGACRPGQRVRPGGLTRQAVLGRLLNAPLRAVRGLRRPRQAWVTLCALAAGGAVLAWWLPANSLDWQPQRFAAEPWRAISAAWVHWSPLHLGANLLGTAVLMALGWAARLPARAALAWLLAWPLTHIALAVQPALAHYGGLSGVLHAGVAVAALWLLLHERAAVRRTIGGAILAGLLLKLVLEEPWGAPLREGGGWDIAVAPLAHATGAAAGAVCALGLWWQGRRPRRL